MQIRVTHDSDEAPRPPMPTQVVSNGEYYPLPKTAAQRQVDERLADYADRFGRKMGMSRRAFLRSACGMAAAMLSINDVFARASGRRGRQFFPSVRAAHAADLDSATALLQPTGDFIFDVQTHHVDVGGDWQTRNPASVRFFACLRSPAQCDGLALLSQQNFIKEVFLDSETTMAILSGVPTRNELDNSLPPVQMAATRDHVNAMAGSERLLIHGLVRPNLTSRRNRHDMIRQVLRLKIASWKAYTGATLGRGGWWLDDERVAYPMYELSLRLGIHNFCVHKGLPLGIFDDTYVRARDVGKAARDWPALNFIIYHSAFPYEDELVAQKALAPQTSNIYCELGSTFAQTIISDPTRTAHVIGKLAKTYGTDHLVWGTDSIWWGSP
ncbi:MAG: amidohydrolase family protein, partial [Verrucomicrobia bacterium]|nr:amidohydrolase family protein [Verrucomicrobiota bacterium]